MLDGLAGIKFLSELKFREIGAILKAHFAFYSRIGYWLKKRKTLRTSSIQISGIYQKSIVFEFYLKGKREFLQTDL